MGNFLHFLAIILVFAVVSKSNASWTSPDSKQYHIQTDEGPERYFKYLTDNGQYRKEKRLKDGTVIGTDAWIDASGILRQKDYIADGAGYRILKSKTVYVGRGQPIEDALRSIKIASHTSPSENVLKSHRISPSVTARPSVSNHITTTKTQWLYYDHPSTPSVYIRPNSVALDNSYDHVTPTSTPIAQYSTETPLFEKHKIPSIKFEPPFRDIKPVALYPTTTPTPITREQFEPIAGEFSPSTSSPLSTLPVTSTSLIEPYPTHLSSLNTDILPPLLTQPTAISHDIDNYIQSVTSTTPQPDALNNQPQPIFSRTSLRRPYSIHNPFLRTNSNYNPNFGSGYESQFPEYDGVSINDSNGFQYFLPRQYHEEISDRANNRAGSFGYIDPFGIRRVVYYNASPDQGFVHKKNNRYVGLDATPYDPRPIE